jgi:phosphopantetheine adenylyltransferase/dephospho-CoA kinase
MARERILVGIAHGPLLVNKTLRELIEPVESRVGFVREFLSDMKPWLQIDVVPITDVFGPTATDGSLECLIITPDSARGGRAVNEERIKRGLPVMTIETVDMVSLGGGLTESVDDKLSSTAIRKQLLGEYVTPSLNRSPQHSVPSEDGPYVVGLTGGIASGKSSVARRLQALGAHVVDCDKLGHKAYEPGTATFCKIVETFGESVVGEGGQINRKTLGGMVFGSKAKMKELTDIVWPEILRLSQEEIKTAWSQGFKVCILDAAVLLEAEWDLHCHEVWVSVVPRSEALQRVVERDGVPEEAANKRIDAQITNEERVSHAHVVLSTLWEREETQRQVDKAWKLLESRIAQKLKSSL